MRNALISVKPRFVQSILSGEKTVELRRRKMNLSAGSKLWIYTTLPKACVEVMATIDMIEFGTPDLIWEKYSNKICITKEEFDSYVIGCKQVSAISLELIEKINHPPDLSFLRSKVDNFHPPQFFKKLPDNSQLLGLLTSFIDN